MTITDRTQEVSATDDVVNGQRMQASPAVALALEQELAQFMAPFLTWLDTRLHKRLVRTVLACIAALLGWRNRAHRLLLSELGGYILDPAHAPVGTKRLSNLLRSPRWQADVITRYLWRQEERRLQALKAAGETALLVWDSNELEKPESLASPDLGSVHSSEAQRLTRIKVT